MKASIQTYKEPKNEVKRISDCEKVHAFFLKGNKRLTTREASDASKMPYVTMQKRIHDLTKRDLLMIVDLKKENGNKNSVYAINKNPDLFGTKYRTKFELLMDALKKSVNTDVSQAVIDEFERMKSEQLKNSKKKKCSGCQTLKPLNDFNSDKKKGTQYYCKECEKRYRMSR